MVPAPTAYSLQPPHPLPLGFGVSVFCVSAFSQVPRGDTSKKTVLAKRTHLTALIHKPKQERRSHFVPGSLLLWFGSFAQLANEEFSSDPFGA